MLSGDSQKPIFVYSQKSILLDGNTDVKVGIRLGVYDLHFSTKKVGLAAHITRDNTTSTSDLGIDFQKLGTYQRNTTTEKISKDTSAYSFSELSINGTGLLAGYLYATGNGEVVEKLKQYVPRPGKTPQPAW